MEAVGMVGRSLGPCGRTVRVTRRGFVLGALGLAAVAVVRPASAATVAQINLRMNGHLECTFASLATDTRPTAGGNAPTTFTLQDGTVVTPALTAWLDDTKKVNEAAPPRPPVKPTYDVPRPEPPNLAGLDPRSQAYEMALGTYRAALAQWRRDNAAFEETEAYQIKLAEWQKAHDAYVAYTHTQQAREDRARWQQLLKLARRDLDLVVKAPSGTGAAVTSRTYHVRQATLKALFLAKAQTGERTVQKLVFASATSTIEIAGGTGERTARSSS